LPVDHRRPGDGGILPALPDRGDHPGPGVRARACRGAAGRARTEPRCAAAGQPFRPWGQGRRHRVPLAGPPGRRGHAAGSHAAGSHAPSSHPRGGRPMTAVGVAFQEAAAAGVPALVMTYWNPVEHYGVDAFARDLAAAGGSGMITPDLTPEEAGPWLDAAATHRLDPVFLVAPSSTPQRIELITGLCGGFVYAASLMGITGSRDTVSGDAGGLVARVRACTSLPVGVGLGVRDGAQAAEVASFADGV